MYQISSLALLLLFLPKTELRGLLWIFSQNTLFLLFALQFCICQRGIESVSVEHSIVFAVFHNTSFWGFLFCFVLFFFFPSLSHSVEVATLFFLMREILKC